MKKLHDIFKENFEDFWYENKEKYPKDMRNHIYTEVIKMIQCGTGLIGFVIYKCLKCLEELKIGFTCKSRFCNKCGQKYIKEWVEKQVNRILDVPHRHCVFTVPEEFRRFFFDNRKYLKELQDMVHEVIEEYANGVNKNNRKEYEKNKRRKKGDLLWKVGIIGVVHTFGRNIRFNPHVHALVAEIKVKEKKIEKMEYLNYSYLRRAWQYKLINFMIEKNPKRKNEYLKYFKKYKDGFYVRAKTGMRSAIGCARYIGRYLAKPAVAEYRIIKYKNKRVVFWYIDHKTEKKVVEDIEVKEFMGRLLMHIPPKYFKMARRYGIYSSNIAKKVSKYVGLIKYIKSGLKKFQYTIKEYWNKKDIKISWREMMIESFSKDPLECKNCGSEMELWEIWHVKYGKIFYLLDLAK